MPIIASSAEQDLAQLTRVAQHFVENELSHRAASFKIGKPNPKVVLPACDNPMAAWANGAAAVGATFVDVSCPTRGWSLRIPVTITEKRLGIVTTRVLRAGDILTGDDLRQLEMGSHHSPRLVTDMSQAIGKTLTTGVSAGTWLRDFMLRTPVLVKTNQPVKVAVTGDGFTIQAEGVALGNASVGERVSIRMTSGRVISGRVRDDGSVVVSL